MTIEGSTCESWGLPGKGMLERGGRGEKRERKSQIRGIGGLGKEDKRRFEI